MSDFSPWSLLEAPFKGIFDIFGAGKQADAAKQAAQTQADAYTKAAQLQATGQANALQFSKTQAEADWANQEINRKANYDMSVAEMQRKSSIGGLFGLPSLNIPAYVPSKDPNYLGGSTTPGSVSSLAGGGSSGTGPSTAGYQPLIDSINKGQDPQAAIAQFNQSQGLPLGNSYAWRAIAGAPGGGVVELPNGQYLTPNPQGVWGVAGNVGGDASSTSASATPTATPGAIGNWNAPLTGSLPMNVGIGGY